MKSLNIKDPEAHQLAAAIAQETGETMTRVVTNALRERFARLPSRRGKASAEELRAIARRTAAHVKPHTWTMRTTCTMRTVCRNDSRHIRPGCHFLWRA